MSTHSLPLTDNYRELLLANTPMIDVRAPVEFASGSLPGAVNLPLMNDDERQAVGICYKDSGQQAAIDLGHQLVNGEVKEERVAAWRQFHNEHPNAVLYCARGGLRSQLSQQWFAESGAEIPRVINGYKALRGFLYNYLQERSARERIFILSGMTGTGKTDLIKQLDNAVDLEGAANHKGSSFGRPIDNQPAQIDFENRVALQFLQLDEKPNCSAAVLEDESQTIGVCAIPHYLLDTMKHSPLVVVDMPFEERLERLWQEYVIDRYAECQKHYGETAEEQFADYLQQSLYRVRKRLGGLRYQQISALMDNALASQHNDNFAQHHHWLAELTRDYYDPMYAYQLDKRKELVAFRGSWQAAKEWLREQ